MICGWKCNKGHKYRKNKDIGNCRKSGQVSSERSGMIWNKTSRKVVCEGNQVPSHAKPGWCLIHACWLTAFQGLHNYPRVSNLESHLGTPVRVIALTCIGYTPHFTCNVSHNRGTTIRGCSFQQWTKCLVKKHKIIYPYTKLNSEKLALIRGHP